MTREGYDSSVQESDDRHHCPGHRCRKQGDNGTGLPLSLGGDTGHHKVLQGPDGIRVLEALADLACRMEQKWDDAT